MTTIPVTILDDFLDNPDTVRDWGLSLEYKSSPNNAYPGERTACLSQIHPPFFDYINRKVLSLFFENPVNYKTNLSFQLIEGYQGTGWIHQDPSLFTYLIYLSPENGVNCGSSLYKLKQDKFHFLNSSQDYLEDNLRIEHHKTKTLSSSTQELKTQIENINYNKTLDVKDMYNRLLCFSSEQFHSANYFSSKKHPRLTLIGFVVDVSKSNIPVLRSKQTSM
jgi:hypothetical protein